MRRLIESIKAERKYIGMAALIFVVSAISGYINADALLQSLKQMGVFDRLEGVVNSIKENPTFLHTLATLFFNNIIASFSMIGMGLLFGLVPFMSMVSNGMLLGVTLMSAAKETGVNPFMIFLTTILPHGILELPGAILAAAFGMRLGAAAFRRVMALVVPRYMEASVQEWKGIRSRFLVVLSGVAILIFVAAIIETSLILYMKPLGKEPW